MRERPLRRKQVVPSYWCALLGMAHVVSLRAVVVGMLVGWRGPGKIRTYIERIDTSKFSISISIIQAHDTSRQKGRVGRRKQVRLR